jgi:hypothetical protein
VFAATFRLNFRRKNVNGARDEILPASQERYSCG